jgi:hypothetical protein
MSSLYTSSDLFAAVALFAASSLGIAIWGHGVAQTLDGQFADQTQAAEAARQEHNDRSGIIAKMVQERRCLPETVVLSGRAQCPGQPYLGTVEGSKTLNLKGFEPSNAVDDFDSSVWCGVGGDAYLRVSFSGVGVVARVDVTFAVKAGRGIFARAPKSLRLVWDGGTRDIEFVSPSGGFAANLTATADGLSVKTSWLEIRPANTALPRTLTCISSLTVRAAADLTRRIDSKYGSEVLGIGRQP